VPERKNGEEIIGGGGGGERKLPTALEYNIKDASNGEN
jgi:hypothetical protein